MTRGQRVWVRFLAHPGLPTDNRWRPAIYLKEWTDRRGRKWHQVALVEERAIFDVREIRTSPPTAAARAPAQRGAGGKGMLQRARPALPRGG